METKLDDCLNVGRGVPLFGSEVVSNHSFLTSFMIGTMVTTINKHNFWARGAQKKFLNIQYLLLLISVTMYEKSAHVPIQLGKNHIDGIFFSLKGEISYTDAGEAPKDFP